MSRKSRFWGYDERTCEFCHKSFKVKIASLSEGRHKGRFCSRDCYHRWTKKNSILIRICVYCRKKFEIRVCDLNNGSTIGKYCSVECSCRAKSRQEKRTCKICDKTFYVKPSWVKKGWGKYCSRACSNRGREVTEATRKKLKLAGAKADTKSPEALKKWAISNKIRPNEFEKQLDSLLQMLFPNEYKYVGDFSFVLGNRCPDFMNINHQKKLIEAYGDYWHQNEDPQNRINHFKQFGFDTLIVWEHELEDKARLVSKLKDFHQRRIECLR